MICSSIILFWVVTVVLAGATAPPGALIVGEGRQFKTIQQAVNVATAGKTIFIEPGIYKEQVFIQKQKKGITIIGASKSPQSYRGNQVSITYNLAQDNPRGSNNDQTGTMRAHGDDFKMYNVNVFNTRGKGSQAVALSAYGDRQGYHGCSFKGFQDTVLSARGRHIFIKCHIEGATDFVFGQNAQSWFEQCNIKVVAPGYITANGRDSNSNPSFYVFNECVVSGSDNLKGKSYLGRPWRQYSRVVFQNSKLGSVINSAGWIEWNKEKPNTARVFYGEFSNTGPGASGTRARFAKKLSAPISRSTVLGSTGWIDSKY